MFDLLLQGFTWVVLQFEDNSKRHVYTTLVPELVREAGVSLKENFVYDFRTGEFISFDGVVSVGISKNKNEFDSEVDRYASCFI